MRNDISWLLDAPIAHRGLHDPSGGIPENSLEAFAEAMARGFAIELDVHLLADGNIAVFHDYDLKRMTGLEKQLAACSYLEIAHRPLLNTACYIPLLQTVLDLVAGRVPILIEIKSASKRGLLELGLKKLLSAYHGPYAIQAFDPLRVNWFRNNAPKIPRGQLSLGFSDESMPRARKTMLNSQILNRLTRPDFIAYNVDTLTDRTLRVIRKQRRPLLLWTVNDREKLSKALPICDNIIFEGLEIGEEYRERKAAQLRTA